MRRKINPTLINLWLGILIYGVVVQIVTLIISRDYKYSLGLWIGIVMAVLAAYYMWWSLDRYLDTEGNANKMVALHACIRYLAFALCILVLAQTDFASPIFAFAGFLGLKAGAYLHPVAARISYKLWKIEEPVVGTSLDEDEK